MLKRLLAICILSLFTTPVLFAQSSVWKAEKDGSVFYLGGTFHILRQSDLPLPEEFDKAYADSEKLVFETDIGALSSMATSQKIMAAAMYSDGSTVEQHLKPETYKLLVDYCAANGVPIDALKVFKPSMIAITLTVMEFMKMGMTTDGVDQLLYKRAKADQKPIDSFETIDEQIGFLANMGAGNEDDFITHTLKNIDDTKQLIEELIAAWKTGDADKLSELMSSELMKTPDLYEQLIVQRNMNWMPKIREFQTTPEKEYILVGAGHLIGPDGILTMLKKEGYKIQQL